MKKIAICGFVVKENEKARFAKAGYEVVWTEPLGRSEEALSKLKSRPLDVVLVCEGWTAEKAIKQAARRLKPAPQVIPVRAPGEFLNAA